MKNVSKGEFWYVQLKPGATLVEFEVLEVTRNTVLLRRITEIQTSHDIARYKISDIEFVEMYSRGTKPNSEILKRMMNES